MLSLKEHLSFHAGKHSFDIDRNVEVELIVDRDRSTAETGEDGSRLNPGRTAGPHPNLPWRAGRFGKREVRTVARTLLRPGISTCLCHQGRIGTHPAVESVPADRPTTQRRGKNIDVPLGKREPTPYHRPPAPCRWGSPQNNRRPTPFLWKTIRGRQSTNSAVYRQSSQPDWTSPPRDR